VVVKGGGGVGCNSFTELNFLYHNVLGARGGSGGEFGGFIGSEVLPC
jgi:hypothetical protein